jgi:hypothetical protein
MASDGCQALPPGVPGGPPVSAGYGNGQVAAAAASSTAPPGEKPYAAGVWYGPAPTGWRTSSETAAPTEKPFDAAKEPRSVALPGGLRLPLLGVAVTDAASVSVSLRLNSLLVSPGHEAEVGNALKAASFEREKLFIAAILPGGPTDAGPELVVPSIHTTEICHEC